MGIYVRSVRGYVCDRCGDGREVEGTEQIPPGWMSMLYGPATAALIADDSRNITSLLCVDCASWLRKFLEGRKVAD